MRVLRTVYVRRKTLPLVGRSGLMDERGNWLALTWEELGRSLLWTMSVPCLKVKTACTI